jgi:predicted HTH domain antitoxin
MVETTLEIKVPTNLLQLGLDRNEVQRRIIEWLVLSLFAEGHISSGKAARLLNMTRVEFLALLHTRGIAYINCTADELEEEFEAVQALEVKKGQ